MVDSLQTGLCRLYRISCLSKIVSFNSTVFLSWWMPPDERNVEITFERFPHAVPQSLHQ